eukprot:213496-Pyramimonas_sp.AAC.1
MTPPQQISVHPSQASWPYVEIDMQSYMCPPANTDTPHTFRDPRRSFTQDPNGLFRHTAFTFRGPLWSSTEGPR